MAGDSDYSNGLVLEMGRRRCGLGGMEHTLRVERGSMTNVVSSRERIGVGCPLGGGLKISILTPFCVALSCVQCL